MKGFKKQKDDSNMNIHRGILRCVFVGCEGPCRDGSCNPCICSHGNGSIGVFNEWKNGTWPTSISSLLGKHSKRLCARKEVRHWPMNSKNFFEFIGQCRTSKISRASKRSFCVPSGTCSRLGFGLLADHGCGTVPVPKETTQITSSSHKTNHTNPHPSDPSSHCHPPLMGWYSAPLLQCKSSRSRYDAHCMPSTRPYGTCCMVVKIWQRGILEITTAMILLVSWIRWQ